MEEILAILFGLSIFERLEQFILKNSITMKFREAFKLAKQTQMSKYVQLFNNITPHSQIESIHEDRSLGCRQPHYRTPEPDLFQDAVGDNV